VRRASAKALGALPAEARGNEALSDALSDEAPSVRAASAESLGARRVTAAAEALRDRLEDPREHFEVRRASAAALGALCDRDSTDTLWKLVRRVDDPMATVEERALGEASLAALARIAPPDLEEKLDPLRRGQARKAVERALARTATQRCR
jgi:HEAT repeat protein